MVRGGHGRGTGAGSTGVAGSATVVRMETTPAPAGPVEARPAKRPLWRRLLKWFLWLAGGFLALLLALVLFAVWAWRTGHVTQWFMAANAGRMQREQPLERPWPPPGTPPGVMPEDDWKGPNPDARQVASAAAFYRTTNLWQVHLHFTAPQWDAVQVRYIRPAMDFNAPDGKFPLRNAAAPRNGLAGVLGLVEPWSTADVEIGGIRFTNAGIRIKGNGTLLNSMGMFKHPYKVDLDREVPGQSLAGLTEFNLGNLASDFSGMGDALSFEYFAAAGVPSPRTAYARLRLSVDGKFRGRPLGLCTLVEAPDKRWAKEVFGKRKVDLFKPVTYDLFADLGTNWSAYQGVYDPKTRVDEAGRRRVMETARFVSGASDAEFAARYAEHFDADEVARFIAAHAFISSYDGFLNNGQNFLMYLGESDGRFGFIPWDQDQSWGEFIFVGSTVELEQASIFRPWVGDNRLLERLFAVPDFRARYRRAVESQASSVFLPERLSRRVDELAALIGPVVDEESDYRRRRFREAVSGDWPAEAPPANMEDPNRPAHRLKRFFVKRAESVRDQLAGRSAGHEFRERKVPGKEKEKEKALEQAKADRGGKR